MKWSDIANRLKAIAGIDPETDVEANVLISKVEEMVSAANTVVTEKTEVQGDINSLKEGFEGIKAILADHKETLQTILSEKSEFEENVKTSLDSITKAIVARKEQDISMESLTIQRESSPIKTEKEEDEGKGKLYIDTDIIHKEINTSQWHR